MPTVMIALKNGTDLSAQMGVMRNWLDTHRCTPSVFKYRHDAGVIVIQVDFIDQETALRFKQNFGGYDGFSSELERRFSRETMETVCWWRLRAEEIRTEAEDYRSRAARETMAEVALSYDRMAENLERRLTNARYRNGLSVA
jgi:anaerobic selenocysteine-containing dehydrogenase